jgi:hypothetical protein
VAVFDTFKPEPAGERPLEEVVGTQAVDVDLRVAIMACLSGGESRRWTVSELVERFKNLGISASRASVTTALAELEVELELSAWAPWRLIERGAEWILAPKSELLELLLGARRLPVKAELSEALKAVLLIVIGHRRKGGVSKTRIAEILKVDSTPLLDDLLRKSLFTSFTDIPALKERSRR